MGWTMLRRIEKRGRVGENYEKEVDEIYELDSAEDFDAFLSHEMDLVVLANYANAHAPFAVKALKAGKTTIVCYSKKYPNKKATCKITVKAVKFDDGLVEVSLSE